MTQTKEMFTDPPAFPGRATASRDQRFFTNHESRLFFALGARRVVPPETAVRTTAPAGKPLFSSSPLFTIVHYCSPLFSKKYCPAPVSSQTVLLGANQDPTMVFTKHESRDTKHGFFSNHRLDSLPTIAHHCPLLPGIARGKILSCASVLVPPGRCFPARCGATRAAMARHGRPPSPAPATRPVGFLPATRHATWVFPVPPATSRRATQSPTNRFFTNHETRDTAIAWRAARASANSKVFTKHESRITAFFRITAFMLPYSPFPTISRYFPALFGPPPPTDQGFARRPPFWASLRTSPVRRRSRRPPGCFPLRRKIDEPKLRKERV